LFFFLFPSESNIGEAVRNVADTNTAYCRNKLRRVADTSSVELQIQTPQSGSYKHGLFVLQTRLICICPSEEPDKATPKSLKKPLWSTRYKHRSAPDTNTAVELLQTPQCLFDKHRSVCLTNTAPLVLQTPRCLYDKHRGVCTCPVGEAVPPPPQRLRNGLRRGAETHKQRGRGNRCRPPFNKPILKQSTLQTLSSFQQC
jgi:hypothetical protein